VHVGGVAGEKDATGALADGLPVMEPEVGTPHGVAQSQRPAGESVRDRLQLDERGLWQLLAPGSAGHGRPHAAHAPARGPAEREEEQTKGHFPNEEAARKLIYLAVTNAVPQWTRTRGWTKALLAFKIHFGDRLPD
jgi:hypothetical protein